MIDFVSVLLFVNVGELLSNPLLKFIEETTDKGEKKLKVNYRGLTFTVVNGVAYITGSLQAFAHYPNGNSQQFSYSELVKALNELKTDFKIDLEKSKLRSFEYCVNVILDHSPKPFLAGLISHKGERFNFDNRKRKKKDFHLCDHSGYSLKYYDKGLQYDSDYILKIENKVKKMETVKIFRIVYLADLKDKNKLSLLRNDLIKQFKQSLIYDYSINIEALPIETQNYLNWGKDHYNWELLKKKDNIACNTERAKYKKKIIECAGRDLLFEYAKLIEATFNNLLEISTSDNLQYLEIDPIDKQSNKIQTDLNCNHTETIEKWSNYKINSNSQNEIIKLPENVFTEPDPPQPENWTEDKTESDQYENLSDRGQLEVNCVQNTVNKSDLIYNVSFVGFSGRFYIQNPDDKGFYAVYNNPDCYNKRLHLPHYLTKSVVMKDFKGWLPIHLSTLTTEPNYQN